MALISNTSRFNIINSDHYCYVVGDALGKGVFGQVAKGYELLTRTKVAIKFQNPADSKYEMSMMSKLGDLDKNSSRLIEYYEYFQWENTGCMVFELLDKSLLDHLQEIKRYSVSDIRLVTWQLVLALQALESVGVVHSDIKMDNVMLVNQKTQPSLIKLIDFGVAFPASTVKLGMMCQPDSLRAPEVTLGLPITQAIDMWSVGLIMGAMFLGMKLYPVSNSYDLLRLAIGTQGQQLPADLLNDGMYTSTFFNKDGATWRLKTPEEFQSSGQQCNPEAKCFFTNLLDLTQCFEVSNDLEYQELCDYVDLMQKMLKLDPRERITPTEALTHDFLNMRNMPVPSSPDTGTAKEGADRSGVAADGPSTVKNQTVHKDLGADIKARAEKKSLKGRQSFFSKVLSILIKPVRKIQTAISNMTKTTPEMCDNKDFITRNTRGGWKHEPLKKILNIISNMLTKFAKPLRKICNVF